MFTIKIGQNCKDSDYKEWSVYSALEYKFKTHRDEKDFCPVAIKGVRMSLKNQDDSQKGEFTVDIPDGEFELYIENAMGQTIYAWRTREHHPRNK